MRLTDARIRQAKPALKARKLSDGGGLFLEIRSTGSKLWRYQYRIAGKANLFAIGVYPAITLHDARLEHLRARALVRQGIHPAHDRAARKAENSAHTADTFKIVAEEWIEAKRTVDDRRGWSPYYEKQVRSYLARDVYPKIGRRSMRSISPSDVLEILRKISDRGAATAAIFVRQIISQVFCYAVPRLRADSDPAHVLRGAISRPTIQHASAKDRAEIKRLLSRIEEYGGARTTAIALHLLLLLFVRTGELRRAKWSEVDFERRIWEIPAERMKKRRTHLVPLCPQAIELFHELRGITGSSIHLFPNLRRPQEVMSATTINRALEHMGYVSGEFTGHDFRATASTRLHEMGFRSEIVEIQLAHANTNKVASAYNHAEYLPERVSMMETWAGFLESLWKGAELIPINSSRGKSR